MVVHGGIDISIENLRDNYPDIYFNDFSSKKITESKTSENALNYILGDFMALDLTNYKWTRINNIVFKKKNSNKLFRFKSLQRVYHSSCLVLSHERNEKGAKINMFKNDIEENDNIYLKSQIETKTKFDIKYEGIYIFGGLDGTFKETNNLYILHCFRNPLVLFEPNNKLYVFGGSDENNKYKSAKLLSIELDLFRNKKLTKIYQYANTVLKENPKDKTAKNVIDLLKDGADLPPDIYPFLKLD